MRVGVEAVVGEVRRRAQRRRVSRVLDLLPDEIPVAEVDGKRRDAEHDDDQYREPDQDESVFVPAAQFARDERVARAWFGSRRIGSAGGGRTNTGRRRFEVDHYLLVEVEVLGEPEDARCQEGVLRLHHDRQLPGRRLVADRRARILPVDVSRPSCSRRRS